MRTFEKKPKTTRPTTFTRSTVPSQANLGQSHAINSILYLERTVGNRSVQRLLRANTPDIRGDLITPESAPLLHDFSQIAVPHGSSANVQAEQQKLTEHAGGAPEFGLSLPASYSRHDGMDARGGGGAEGEVEDQHAGTNTGTTTAATSGGTTERPIPIAVRNGPAHAPINSGDRVGMSIAITISSSSGKDADMAAIQDSEQVGFSYNHTGSMVGVDPLPSSQSGFMPGYPIPDDQHAWSKAAIIDRADNHGGDGSFEKKQLDIYTDAAGGIKTATEIPDSGYVIKRIIKKEGTKITLRTEKRAEAVSVNAYTTGAGPSATAAEDVEVRP